MESVKSDKWLLVPPWWLFILSSSLKAFVVDCWLFFKINFFKKYFQDQYQSVRQLGFRSRPTFCQSWSGSKLFAKVIRSQQKSPLARKELWLIEYQKANIYNLYWEVYHFVDIWKLINLLALNYIPYIKKGLLWLSESHGCFNVMHWYLILITIRRDIIQFRQLQDWLCFAKSE